MKKTANRFQHLCEHLSNKNDKVNIRMRLFVVKENALEKMER